MIAPQPFIFECPKCGYSKIVKPKSDVINSIEMMGICPKCKTKMERKELDGLSKIFWNLFTIK